MSSPVPDVPNYLLELGILDDSNGSDSPLAEMPKSDCSGNDSDSDYRPCSRRKLSFGVLIAETSDESEPDSSSSAENVPETQVLLPADLVVTENVDGKTSKKQRRPHLWPRNIKNKQRAAGKIYSDEKGIIHPARKPKYGQCKHDCNLKCSMNIIQNEQHVIFTHFWKLSDEKKLHFYAKFVERTDTARKRTDAEVSRRTNSFKFFFEVEGSRIRVCRDFFLGVLDISKQRVYYFFKTKFNSKTGVALTPTKGKHTKNTTNFEVLEGVRSHIKSFPVVESHYCRARSAKKYLDPQLSVAEMHRLYEASEFSDAAHPIKINKYRQIFLNEFNLAFHHPKKDRCDLCEAHKMVLQPNAEDKEKFDAHIQRKTLGKIERDGDRTLFNRGSADNDTMVICFDMEKVISLPKAEISSFYYLRKLNCYNLTAHCSLDGTTFCALWNEAISGRAGNHIASALVKILYSVQDEYPHLKKLVLWSDSCVPQNKNSVMSTAISTFLADEAVSIQCVEQKFGEPGHGNVQEIDAVHSKIDRGLKSCEIFSPVSLLRRLLKLSSARIQLKIIQLKSEDFLNYQIASKCLNFKAIPFTKVKSLKYISNEPNIVRYRLSFAEPEQAVKLFHCQTDRVKSPNIVASPLFKKIGPINEPAILAPEKIADIKKMFRYMPPVDVEYFRCLLKL